MPPFHLFGSSLPFAALFLFSKSPLCFLGPLQRPSALRQILPLSSVLILPQAQGLARSWIPKSPPPPGA